MRNGRFSTSGSTQRSIPRKRAHPEDDMQRALFQWITLATPRIPQLALAFHPANGGKRDPREAARLKGLGVRPGVPDVMIPAPNYDRHRNACEPYDYHGLAIELKAGKNRPTSDQVAWADNLRKARWQVRLCYSFDEARQVIADYFGVKP